MSVFRVLKNKNYTAISNFHIFDIRISLKAKGLLSQMLCLPDNWNYSINGFAAINKENRDAILSTIKELENAGYINRQRRRNAKGFLQENEYLVYETPEQNETWLENNPDYLKEIQELKQAKLKLSRGHKTLDETPKSENPTLDESGCLSGTQPKSENPTLDESGCLSGVEPKSDNPTLDYPIQQSINTTKILKKQRINNMSVYNNLSINPINQLKLDDMASSSDKALIDRIDRYRQIIKRNIDYNYLALPEKKLDISQLDEIVELITENVAINTQPVSINGNKLPAEVVREKYLKLTSSEIEYVMTALSNNTTKIINIKAYLLTVLYNASSTINNYYSAEVKHDMANWKGGE